MDHAKRKLEKLEANLYEARLELEHERNISKLDEAPKGKKSGKPEMQKAAKKEEQKLQKSENEIRLQLNKLKKEHLEMQQQITVEQIGKGEIESAVQQLGNLLKKEEGRTISSDEQQRSMKELVQDSKLLEKRCMHATHELKSMNAARNGLQKNVADSLKREAKLEAVVRETSTVKEEAEEELQKLCTENTEMHEILQEEAEVSRDETQKLQKLAQDKAQLRDKEQSRLKLEVKRLQHELQGKSKDNESQEALESQKHEEECKALQNARDLALKELRIQEQQVLRLDATMMQLLLELDEQDREVLKDDQRPEDSCKTQGAQERLQMVLQEALLEQGLGSNLKFQNLESQSKQVSNELQQQIDIQKHKLFQIADLMQDPSDELAQVRSEEEQVRAELAKSENLVTELTANMGKYHKEPRMQDLTVQLTHVQEVEEVLKNRIKDVETQKTEEIDRILGENDQLYARLCASEQWSISLQMEIEQERQTASLDGHQHQQVQALPGSTQHILEELENSKHEETTMMNEITQLQSSLSMNKDQLRKNQRSAAKEREEAKVAKEKILAAEEKAQQRAKEYESELGQVQHFSAELVEEVGDVRSNPEQTERLRLQLKRIKERAARDKQNLVDKDERSLHLEAEVWRLRRDLDNQSAQLKQVQEDHSNALVLHCSAIQRLQQQLASVRRNEAAIHHTALKLEDVMARQTQALEDGDVALSEMESEFHEVGARQAPDLINEHRAAELRSELMVSNDMNRQLQVELAKALMHPGLRGKSFLRSEDANFSKFSSGPAQPSRRQRPRIDDRSIGSISDISPSDGGGSDVQRGIPTIDESLDSAWADHVRQVAKGQDIGWPEQDPVLLGLRGSPQHVEEH
eukprot:gnl/MRDRNA2_/MRDRNA2_65110_c0_seq1.p1 gnl/MRDRNA2_/MRDRNA2_65110_c0~~gnl/MRDRNA2_/MRDRNA2_65110_c0_seq1.p1  ORF type:complete len:960 (+),score=291.62 gnl/MRDRNA2_/MRDRNA2_65110_c0_seq1:284-2881(+)